MLIVLRKIGNSKGMIFSSSLLAQAGLSDAAEVTIEDGAIVLRAPSISVRAGWAKASKAIAQTEDEALVMGEFANNGDAELQW